MVIDEKDNLLQYLHFEPFNKDENIQLKLIVQEHLLDSDGNIPSGVFSIMLDTVIGATISYTLDGFALTMNLNCSYFELTNRVKYSSSAKIIHQDNRIVTGEGTIVDQEGNVVARGVGTFKLL